MRNELAEYAHYAFSCNATIDADRRKWNEELESMVWHLEEMVTLEELEEGDYYLPRLKRPTGVTRRLLTYAGTSETALPIFTPAWQHQSEHSPTFSALLQRQGATFDEEESDDGYYGDDNDDEPSPPSFPVSSPVDYREPIGCTLPMGRAITPVDVPFAFSVTGHGPAACLRALKHPDERRVPITSSRQPGECPAVYPVCKEHWYDWDTEDEMDTEAETELPYETDWDDEVVGEACGIDMPEYESDWDDEWTVFGRWRPYGR